MKKAHNLSTGNTFGTIKDNNDFLKLTTIEAYILSTFCCEGMPLIFDSNNFGTSVGKCAKTWTEIANSLKDMARQQLQHAKDQVTYCNAAISKAASQKSAEDEQLKSLASNLSRAEADFLEKEEAARLAADFAVEPDDRLSKKRLVEIVMIGGMN